MIAHRPRAGRRIRGFTLLETQVAFVLLGIGLAGVCPLVVMQLKLSRKVAGGLDPVSSYFGAGQTFLLAPASATWSRKLGVPASILASGSDVPAYETLSTATDYAVSIVSAPERSADGESVTVHVSIAKSTASGGSSP